MDDPASVGVREALGGLLPVLEHVLERERRGALPKLGFERSSGKKFQREKLPITGRLHRVNGGNVRVIQGGKRIRFLEKSLKMQTRATDVRRQKLQRHVPVQLLIEGLIDDPHSAFAQLGLNLIVKDPLSLRERFEMRVGTGVGGGSQSDRRDFL